jgi:hypothetical protein
MYLIEAHDFIGALTNLDELDGIAKVKPEWVYGTNLQWFNQNLESLLEQLHKMRLRLSIKKADYIKRVVNGDRDSINMSDTTLAEMIKPQLKELRERIKEELEERRLYCVDPFYIEILNQSAAPFGDKVAVLIPNVSSDLTDATLCLAMSRYTACVFHLMRAMEHSVMRLGQKLNVTVIDKNNTILEWGPIISNINDVLHKMPKDDYKTKWSAVASLLHYVRIAWRNSTMHPKNTYTEDEARDVYNSCKSFMSYLVELL